MTSLNDRISMKYATMFQFFIDNNIAFAKFCNTKFCSQPIRSKKKFNDFLFSFLGRKSGDKLKKGRCHLGRQGAIVRE